MYCPNSVLRQMPHEDPHGLQRSGRENPCKEPQKCSSTLPIALSIAGMPISGNVGTIWKAPNKVRDVKGPKSRVRFEPTELTPTPEGAADRTISAT